MIGEKNNEQETSFEVTTRPFDSILREVGMKKQDILELPKAAVVVEVGSGVFQEFAYEVNKLRPDIRMISIDPTMAFSRDRKDVRLGTKGTAYNYEQAGDQKGEEIRRYQTLHGERIDKHLPGTISALASDLPFADGSIDLLVDCWGPAIYLRKYNDFSDYIYEISRVLKNGGIARLKLIGPNMDTALSIKEEGIAVELIGKGVMGVQIKKNI
jgi:SAM-dependent methyltransferase